jgi:hypothetical protein
MISEGLIAGQKGDTETKARLCSSVLNPQREGQRGRSESKPSGMSDDLAPRRSCVSVLAMDILGEKPQARECDEL